MSTELPCRSYQRIGVPQACLMAYFELMTNRSSLLMVRLGVAYFLRKQNLTLPVGLGLRNTE